MNDVNLSQKEKKTKQNPNLKVENPHKTQFSEFLIIFPSWLAYRKETKHGFAESYGVLVLGSVSFDHRDDRV